MGRIAAVLLVLLAGCDKLFGLAGSNQEIDAPVADASSPDVPVDAPCPMSETAPVSVTADTFLVAETNLNPAIRTGSAQNVNIGQSGTDGPDKSRALFRFTLSAPMLALLTSGDPSLYAATLTVRLRNNDCGCTNEDTTFQILAATNEWNEGGADYFGATWQVRRQDGNGDPNKLMWQQAGAMGPMDIDPELLGSRAVTAPNGNQVIKVALDLTGLKRQAVASRLAGDQLSLIAVPTDGGTLFLYARERDPNATTLTFSYCVPPPAV